MQFPDEDKRCGELGRELKDHFEFARRALRFWLEYNKERSLDRSGLPHVVLRVAVGMNVRTCRQYRTVIELCARGEAADAEILVRSMFEALLVTAFVLKPRVRLRGYIADPTHPLTREFRAYLYLAHLVFRGVRYHQRYKDKPGRKRWARMLKEEFDPQTIRRYEMLIGPNWTKRLRRYPYTYSGLTIADLARSLGKGFANYYEGIYPFQSEHIHAADVIDFMDVSETGDSVARWQSPITSVRRVLEIAALMFLVNIGVLNEYVGFGVGMNTAIDNLHNEHSELMQRD